MLAAFTFRPAFSGALYGLLLLTLGLTPFLYFFEFLWLFVVLPGQPFPWRLFYFCLFLGVFWGLAWFFVQWQMRRPRLIFTATALIYEGFFRWQSWRYPYTDIVAVVDHLHATCCIQTTHGKVQALSAVAWHHPGTTPLAELRRHLPPVRFAPNLDQQLRRVGTREILIGLSYVGYLLLLFYWMGGHFWVRDHFTWPRLSGSSYAFADWLVNGLSFTSQGAPTFVVQPNPSAPAKNFSVQQHHATGVQTWPVPTNLDWGPLATADEVWVQGVAFDAQEHPRVFVGGLSGPKRMLAWDGTQWQMQHSPLGNDLITEMVLRGPNVWAIASDLEHPAKLVYWNATAAMTLPVPLTGAAEPTVFEPFQLTPTAAGQMLVGIRSRTETRLLAYPLTLTVALRPTVLLTWPDAQGYVQSFAQAPNGDLWLMVYARAPEKKEFWRYQPATATWQTFPLPEPEASNILYGSKRFWVDAHQRLWVFVDDLTDTVLDIWSIPTTGLLQHLSQYTENNINVSLYSSLHLPQLGPDGRLWLSGSTLIWADTTALTLPPALPAWLNFPPFSWQIYAIMIGYLVLAGFIEYLNYQHTRARLQSLKRAA